MGQFIRSSAGPLKPAAYYRAKLAGLAKRRGALAALGTPAADRSLAMSVLPKIAYYEGRLRMAERAGVRAEGAAACRVGKPLAACPVHPTLPAKERLFCAWCQGWWDERIPTTRRE